MISAGRDPAVVKKYLIRSIPYLLIWYLADKYCWLYRMAPGKNTVQKIIFCAIQPQSAFISLLPSLHHADMLAGAAAALLIRAVVYLKGKNAKKYRHGIEYGSARWSA